MIRNKGFHSGQRRQNTSRHSGAMRFNATRPSKASPRNVNFFRSFRASEKGKEYPHPSEFPFKSRILESLYRDAEPLDSIRTWKEHPIPRFPRLINQRSWWKYMKRAFSTSLILLWNWQFRSFQVEGVENLPRKPDRPVIYVANHRSLLDPPFIGAILSRYVQPPWFMAKKELWKTIFHRLLYNLSAVIPMDRGAINRNKMQSFVSILKAQRPEMLVLFIEGTRPGSVKHYKDIAETLLYSDLNPETGLLHSHPAAAQLALATGALLIPIGISGASVAKPALKARGIYPRKRIRDIDIKLRIGKPLDPYRDMIDQIEPDKSGKRKLPNGVFRELTHTLEKRISDLVFWEWEHFPKKLPITQGDLDQQREFEKAQADKLEFEGSRDLAEKIRQRHKFQLEQEKKHRNDT